MTKREFFVWVKALRLFATPASVMPILLAAVYVFFLKSQPTSQLPEVRWWLLPLIILATLSYHLGGNLISDFHDWKRGIDRPDTFGSSRVLVLGELPAHQLLQLGYGLIGLGSCLGLIILYYTGWPLVWIGLAGCLGGLFYSHIKYIALGELLIFLLFGLLILAGSMLVLLGDIPSQTWLLALPLAFLSTAILLANNIRDIQHDQRAQIKTTAILLGIEFSKLEYALLLTAAYFSILMLIYFDILGRSTLLTFISLPMAVYNIKYIYRARVAQPELSKDGDALSAQLYLFFALLLTGGVLFDCFY